MRQEVAKLRTGGAPEILACRQSSAWLVTCRSWTCPGVGMPLPKRARKAASSQYLSASSTFMMPNSSSMLFCTGVPAQPHALWRLQDVSCLRASRALACAAIPINCSSRSDLQGLVPCVSRAHDGASQRGQAPLRVTLM